MRQLSCKSWCIVVILCLDAHIGTLVWVVVGMDSWHRLVVEALVRQLQMWQSSLRYKAKYNKAFMWQSRRLFGRHHIRVYARILVVT